MEPLALPTGNTTLEEGEGEFGGELSTTIGLEIDPGPDQTAVLPAKTKGLSASFQPFQSKSIAAEGGV